MQSLHPHDSSWRGSLHVAMSCRRSVVELDADAAEGGQRFVDGEEGFPETIPDQLLAHVQVNPGFLDECEVPAGSTPFRCCLNCHLVSSPLRDPRLADSFRNEAERGLWCFPTLEPANGTDVPICHAVHLSDAGVSQAKLPEASDLLDFCLGENG